MHMYLYVLNIYICITDTYALYIYKYIHVYMYVCFRLDKVPLLLFNKNKSISCWNMTPEFVMGTCIFAYFFYPVIDLVKIKVS